MFTGIIEEIGSIKNILTTRSGKRFEVGADLVLEDLRVDQSVSVNGVCLTVVDIGSDSFFADAVAETLRRSTLSLFKRGEPVNLERALRLQDRLGGHLVQGHVDGVGSIRRLKKETSGHVMEVEIPRELEKYVIAKGSIAIDGVSLTVAEKKENLISVAVIPHTMAHTIFQHKKVGDGVNIEVDFFAKYIEQFILKSGETKITRQWLNQHGF